MQLAWCMTNPIVTEYDAFNRIFTFKQEHQIVSILKWSKDAKVHIYTYSLSKRQVAFNGLSDTAARHAVLDMLEAE